MVDLGTDAVLDAALGMLWVIGSVMVISTAVELRLSVLDVNVVIALTVAVIVPAIFGRAPTTESQIVYPL